MAQANLLDPSDVSLAILGGGPGGYEAASVAAQLGARVTLIEEKSPGGSAVLTDAVPSKTLIATADVMSTVDNSRSLGVRFPGHKEGDSDVEVDLGVVNRRVLALTKAQSVDIQNSLERAGVTVINGRGRLAGPRRIVVESPEGGVPTVVNADAILLATGTHPRQLTSAPPDGERILNWTQLYHLKELPQELIVVGSGVTGAEFASAYQELGSQVTLVSSRDRVLPGQDVDAAEVLESVLTRRGMRVLSQSRADSVERVGDRVVVTLGDGRTIEGSHCLVAVGSIPNTTGIGLEDVGVSLSDSGHILVDGVSRTSIPGIYAAGDCTGVLPLASVAGMQGRIAVSHLLGDTVSPMDLRHVTANIFTSPEIASVGYSQEELEAESGSRANIVKLPLATNPRAKMLGITDGFVKLFARKGSGSVLGGVVVGPKASELIFPIALAVEHRMTVDDVAKAFTVYPSLSGSIAEAARKLHHRI